MNRLKYFLFVIYISITLLGGCSKPSDRALNSLSSEQTAVCGFNSDSLGKDGVVYQEGGLLHFSDLSSGENIVLCNKPNCKHIPYNSISNPDPYCDAALPFEGKIYSFIYKNTIYALVSSMSTEVYQREAGGSGWTKTLDTPYPICPIDMVVEENSLYLVAFDVEVNKETNVVSTKPFVMEINLKDHTYRKLSNTREAISENNCNLVKAGDYLYYADVYLDNSYADISARELSKFAENAFTTDIYQVNLENSSTACVFSNKDDKKQGFIGIHENNIYFYKNNELVEFNIKTKNENVLWKADNPIISGKIYDNVILIDDTDNIELYIWYIDKNKAAKLNRTPGEAFPLLCANGTVMVNSYEGEDVTVNIMTLYDYLHGKKAGDLQFKKKDSVK